MACRNNAPRHVRHSQLKDVMWRAVKKRRHQRTRSQSNCYEQIGHARMERPWFGGRAKNRWHGTSQSHTPMPRRTYHLRRSKLVQLPRGPPRIRCQSTPPSRHPLVGSHRDKRRLVLGVGGIHRGSRQAHHRHHWRANGDNVFLSEDISDITERQCSRFSQHFHRVIIFT